MSTTTPEPDAMGPDSLARAMDHLLAAATLLAEHSAKDATKRCKALSALICHRPGCYSLISGTRRRGSPQRFCSGRCRWLAWRERTPG